MNKSDLQLFGLQEGATKEEVRAAYDNLRAKYLEERFLDGEAGNNAAKMLTKLDVAYNELMNEFDEASTATQTGDAFVKVEEALQAGNLQEAQRLLDCFNERNGKWHYMQSVVFYRKNWMNESKKQLEIAIQLEPENEKYKDAYKKLNDKLNYDAQSKNSTYQGQTVNSVEPDEQMGGNFCANCIQCCYINLCINCLCDTCCRCY